MGMENIIKLIPGTFLLYSGKYDFDNELVPFQVNNNFYYLTGLDIPNFAILYNHMKKKYFYFFEYKDIIWFDNNSYLKGFSDEINIIDINEIDKYINDVKKISSLNNFTDLSDKIKIKITVDSENIDKIRNEMRVIKKKEEIKNLEKACKISSDAITDIIKNCKIFSNEENIVSRFKKYILCRHNKNIPKIWKIYKKPKNNIFNCFRMSKI